MADIHERRNGHRQKSRIVIALACIVMYAMATAHWVLSLRTTLANDAASQTLRSTTSDCLKNLAEGETCTLTQSDIFDSLGQLESSCETTSFLFVNVSVNSCNICLNCSFSIY